MPKRLFIVLMLWISLDSLCKSADDKSITLVGKTLTLLPKLCNGDLRNCYVTRIEFTSNSKFVAIESYDVYHSEYCRHVYKPDKEDNWKVINGMFTSASMSRFPKQHSLIEKSKLLFKDSNELSKRKIYAASPDGKLFAISGSGIWKSPELEVHNREKKVAAIHVRDGAGPEALDGLYKPQILSCSFSKDSKYVAISTEFFDDELPRIERVQILDVNSGRLSAFFPGACCRFSPEGKLIAYIHQSSFDRRVSILDPTTFRTLRQLDDEVQKIEFSPDGNLLATLSMKDTLKLWSMATHKHVATLGSPLKNITSFAFSPDGKQMMTGNFKGKVQAWDLTPLSDDSN